MQNVHFRLTSVAQKRLCLSSLMSEYIPIWMVKICCATTDNTSKSMRLNSSKQDHAPHDANPCKRNKIEIAPNDVNSYVKTDLRGNLRLLGLYKAWNEKSSLKQGQQLRSGAFIHDCPFLLLLQTEVVKKCEECNPILKAIVLVLRGHFTPGQLVHTLFSIEKLECISYSYSLICSVNYSGNLPSYPSANSIQ